MINKFGRFLYDVDALGELTAIASDFLKSDCNGLILISGRSGSGKTTLARAFMIEAEQCGKCSKILTTMECVDKLMDRSINEEFPNSLLQGFLAYDLIVLEKYDYLSGKITTQHDVREYLLKPLLESGKKIIITFIEKADRSSIIALPAHIRIDLAPADVNMRLTFARACVRDLGIGIDHCTEIYLAKKCPIHAIRAKLQHTKLAKAI